MSTQLQLRRGTAAENAAKTGAAGEPLYATDTKRLAIHDGSTAGGTLLPNYKDLQNATFTYAAAGGTADAITASTLLNPTALTAGMAVDVKIASANTGAATLTWGSTTTKNIKKFTSGSKVDVAAGDLTAGQVYRFTYDGTDYLAAGVIQTPTPSGWVPLQTQTVSSTVASVDFTSGIDATYQRYAIVLDNVKVSTDGDSITLYTGNGGTFDTGSSDYSYTEQHLLNATTGVSGDETYNGVAIGYGIGNAATEFMSGILYILNAASSTTHTLFFGDFQGMGTDSIAWAYKVIGRRKEAAAHDRVRFSSSNFTAGTFTLYGLKGA